MKKYILSLFFLFVTYVLISSQKREDTIISWRQKFATLAGIPRISSKGTWISIYKSNKQMGDSTFVINTQNNTKTIYKLSSSQVAFLNEKAVLGTKGSNAECLDLTTGKISTYKDVFKIYTMATNNRYAILFNNRQINFYDQHGNPKLEISNVVDLPISDSKNTVYLKMQNAGKWQIIEVRENIAKEIYTTPNKIQKMEITPSGEQLLLTETIKGNKNNRLIILDTKIPEKQILGLDIPDQAIVHLTEIQQGLAYLISVKVRFSEVQDPSVETWYGNDTFVNEHYKMFTDKKFWIWHPKNKRLQRIVVPANYEVNSLNNDRYFLTYPPRKRHNYVTSEPELNDAQIYDLKLSTRYNLGNFKLVKQLGKEWPLLLNHPIFCSANGKWLLGSTDGIKWILYNSNGEIDTQIDKTGLEQPVFSKNGEYIYFESSDDLWSFNTKQKKLTALGIGKGKMIKIKNYIYERDGYTMVSFLPTENLLVEMYDKENNIISYALFQNGKWQQVIPPTKNRINNNLLYNSAMTSFYALEENYNMPPRLFRYDKGGQQRLFFDGNISDDGAKKIRQEIYAYSAVGKNLTGILYYPANFDPTKKYPMIVRIYDRQRHLSNGYLSPKKSMPEGSQFRTLLEQGYFVFLPDTTVGEKGPGPSALECVHNALDAISKNPNIDHTKIGLCGQSYGGYKTNFIATHSDRFATYISGAGISDFIRYFYSYSTDWNKPLYFTNNTFYQMGTTPADDKERYLKNDPILNVQNVNAPILLWAGKKDGNVPWTQSMEFYIGLRRYKKDVIALFYPNGDHSFLDGTSEQIDLSKKVLEWWDYFLKDKREDITWIDKQIKKDAQ